MWKVAKITTHRYRIWARGQKEKNTHMDIKLSSMVMNSFWLPKFCTQTSDMLPGSPSQRPWFQKGLTARCSLWTCSALPHMLTDNVLGLQTHKKLRYWSLRLNFEPFAEVHSHIFLSGITDETNLLHSHHVVLWYLWQYLQRRQHYITNKNKQSLSSH